MRAFRLNLICLLSFYFVFSLYTVFLFIVPKYTRTCSESTACSFNGDLGMLTAFWFIALWFLFS